MWNEGETPLRQAALVAVELGGANGEQESRFDEEMARRSWVRCPTQQTCYRVDFEGVDSDADMVQATEYDVTASAEAAHIYDWEAMLLLDNAC